jgi:hypothetical protein
MKHLSRMKLSSILALVLLCLWALPLAAQDVTAEPDTVSTAEATADAPVVIAQPGGVVINTGTTETPPDPDEPWAIKYLAALAGLIVLSGTTLALANKWLETKKADSGFLTLGEQIYKWSPQFLRNALKELIKQFVRLGGNLEEIFDELGDDVPYVVKAASKTATPPADSDLTWKNRPPNRES